jgi:hypothetical protein
MQRQRNANAKVDKKKEETPHIRIKAPDELVDKNVIFVVLTLERKKIGKHL